MKNMLTRYFHIPKEGKLSEKLFMRNIALAVFIILMCLTSMSLTAYAYFTASITLGGQTIQAAHFDCDITIKQNGTEVVPTAGKLAPGSYEVTIKKSVAENSASTGFCVIELGGQEFHTQQLGLVGDTMTHSITFTLQLGGTEPVAIQFLPHWGTSSHYAGFVRGEADEFYLTDGEDLLIGTMLNAGEDGTDETPTEPETQPAVDSTEPSTEASTEPVTEAPTQPATEPPTEPATVPPTEPETEPVTEPATEPATEAAAVSVDLSEEISTEPVQSETEPEQPTEVTENP